MIIFSPARYEIPLRIGYYLAYTSRACVYEGLTAVNYFNFFVSVIAISISFCFQMSKLFF